MQTEKHYVINMSRLLLFLTCWQAVLQAAGLLHRRSATANLGCDAWPFHRPHLRLPGQGEPQAAGVMESSDREIQT